MTGSISTRLTRAVASTLFCVGVCLAAGCTSQTSAPARAPEIKPWGFDLTGMDTSVKPGDDFYSYANGNWNKRTQIPADRVRWGSFDILRAKSEDNLKTVVEATEHGARAPGSVEQKVADYYESYLNTEAIEQAGLKPAQADLDAIAKARTHEDIARLMGVPALNLDSPIGIGATPDDKDPNRYTMRVVQSGLGMPTRDYYLDKDDKSADTRAKYRAYIEQMLTLAHYPEPAKSADAIYAVEISIAEAHWPNEKRRNRDLTYNPKTRAELVSFAPDYPWSAMFETAGLASQDSFVVAESDAVQKLAALFKSTPVETWRGYLTFHYLNAFADVLPAAFDHASFEFNNRVLNGQLEQRARWKRAVNAVDGSLGEASGKLYVERYFPPDAKAKMLALVQNLRGAYRVRINHLEWMSSETKKSALRKLDTLAVKIGYPDHWRDYSAFEVRAGDALGNRKRAGQFDWDRRVKRLNGPTDRGEWNMTPPTVNAYYNPRFNEIVFPAAILQPPYFDPNADMAVNYGAIGGVIGHEMSHGYDDQGAKSDEHGVLHTWWQPNDVSQFKTLTQKLAAQYDTYEPLAGLHINGNRTLGENIGDHGGLTVSYEAYELSLKGKKPPVLNGFTAEQRVFLGWAQVWRDLIRDDALRNRIVSDPHSPAEFRVNGTIVNVDAWYRAFDVKPGDKLYLSPEQRVHIW
jgi:putative endopeptidase